MVEPNLKCNYPKCTLFVTGRATVTSCSHIFCKMHKIHGGVAVTCPACKSMLDGKKDVFLKNLNPPDEIKAMALNGYSPDMVFQVMTKALQFWTYQINLQILCQEKGIEHLRVRLAERESTLEKIELNIKHYIQNQEKKIDFLNTEVAKLTKSLNETENQLNEKNRQLYNLQSRYDQLRRQSVASIITKTVEPEDQEPLQFRNYNLLINREYVPQSPRNPSSFHFPRFHSMSPVTDHHPQPSPWRVYSQ